MEKDWSNLAENFDDLQKYIVGDVIDKIIKDELLNLKNLGNVIEFGCGVGNYTKPLASSSNSILATDISDDMIKFAKEELVDFSNIKVEKASCYGTDFEDKSYDTVFMANLIHVVKDPKKVLEESHRLLKDGGKLIIVSFTPDGMSLTNKMKMIAKYLKTFGPPPKGSTPFKLKSLTEFVSTHNFKIEISKLLGKKESKAIFIVAEKV
ncbi:MAG: hypothetical protein CR982_07480 [Candidatus Cloacimonadota bacterium]|nr:MAG: hypothetical protein CR982_07480 [Candidatus Cloacimonadota bacterium]PIE80172.1 MAG: hypothetical protein CSA15_02125 [Candidatus Delongbacteria bacterium]